MSPAGRSVVFVLGWSLAVSLTTPAAAQENVPKGVEILLPTETESESPAAPDMGLPPAPPSAMWRALKQGQAGRVRPSGARDGVLIRTEAEQWRRLTVGPLRSAAAWTLLLLFVVLVALHVARGRERAPAWESGREVLRFNRSQRLSHWLVAGCFAVLSLTGLNLMYGRAVLAPLTGIEAFAAIAHIGRYLHAAAGIGFAAGLLFLGALWLGERAADRRGPELHVDDGLMRPPPRLKYTIGQRLGLWFFLCAGLMMVVTGGCLLFLLSYRGPIPIQGVQIAHSIIGLAMIVVAVVHCYQTAIARERGAVAMLRGAVSEEWAARHHGAWLASATAAAAGGSKDVSAPDRSSATLRAVAGDRTTESLK